MEVPTVALVLAGGTGTRLYPASRPDRPKQFLSFVEGEPSLLRQTVDRASFADETVVLTSERHVDLVTEHVPDADVLVEPAPKDTGPALVYATRRVGEEYGDCVTLCLPADHRVEGDFETAARAAVRAAAETNGLVTMGVDPTRPATGYGYVRPADDGGSGGGDDRSDDGGRIDDAGNGGDDDYAPVARFEEKPTPERAARLLAEGCYWNAGIFAWRPDAFLRECAGTPLASLATASDLDAAFAAVEPVSVDYAVLERTDEAYVVPATFEWDDLGSWDALERVLETDDAGNAVLGDAIALDASGNVLASDDALVTVAGVDDLVVAAYDDRVLVVPKDEAQRVRDVVTELERRGRF